MTSLEARIASRVREGAFTLNEMIGSGWRDTGVKEETVMPRRFQWLGAGTGGGVLFMTFVARTTTLEAGCRIMFLKLERTNSSLWTWVCFLGGECMTKGRTEWCAWFANLGDGVGV